MHYNYRAVDKLGRTLTGEREIGSERELAEVLRHDGLLLLDVETPTAKSGRGFFSLFSQKLFGGVSLVQRMLFARNLAVMIGAGLPLTRALEAFEQQSPNRAFREILASVRETITGGKTLAEGLTPYEHIFGPLFINMVESGEISGNLERVLKILALQMKRDHELRSKVRGALIYPAIVVMALVIIGILMMVYVVPTLTQTFMELEVELPFTTRMIIGTSNLLLHYYIFIIPIFLGVVFIGFRLLKTERGKYAFDHFILHVPIFGPLIQKMNSARFARTLASLIASGIQITRALEVTASVLGNIQFRKAAEEAMVSIQHGKPLSEILGHYPKLFPTMVTQMIQVGEETGTISKMLLRLALFYEEEVNQVTKNMSSVIEPVLMLVIGAIVGFFAISMIQPIYGGLGNI